MKGWSAIILIFLLAAVVSCSKEEPAPVTYGTPYTIRVPFLFPDKLNIPSGNPMTMEGIELGRYLFYDGRVSGRTDPDSLMSCSTCHLQSHSFECGIDNPKFTGGRTYGLTGILTPHYMVPMINLVWNDTGYLWNGSIYNSNPDEHHRNIEDLTWMAITAPHEMNGDTNRSKALIQSIPGYPALFRKAFGSETVTVKNMGRAIAQFIRTLISADSKFDRYLAGKEDLTTSERNGYVLFMTEEGGDCFHCHGGDGNPLFTTNLFYNNAKDSVFTDTRDRYHVTGRETDIGAYKAPTLRNLAFTAPYMHDGRFTTLDEVIDFYSSGLVTSPWVSPLMHHLATHGAILTPQEKTDLKTFLFALSDSSFTINPAFSKPATFPDGTSQ
jgi:cytochrome c peroxidase